MRAARWTLRVVMLVGACAWLPGLVPPEVRTGIREALRPPAVATMRVDHVQPVEVEAGACGIIRREWIITAGNRSFCTSDDQVGSLLKPGCTYVLRYHGNLNLEQCRILSILAER